MSQSLEHQGVGSRIVTEVFKLAGYDVEYGFFPWDKSLKLARLGLWQGSITWTYNTEREQFFAYSDPVFTEAEVFFYLKNKNFDWNS